MTTTTTITIEQLEALVRDLEGEERAVRDHLLRMIRAYARIIAVREPERYESRACRYADEDGHCDGSYPPKQAYSERRGPRTIRVREHSWEEIATTRGYYHEWRASTTSRGIYVDAKGRLWGASHEGTGSFSAFAAHPGSCDVDITISWDVLDLDGVPTADLRAAEEALRAIAFPLLSRSAP
jgi:hypothetical protein